MKTQFNSAGILGVYQIFATLIGMGLVGEGIRTIKYAIQNSDANNVDFALLNFGAGIMLFESIPVIWYHIRNYEKIFTLTEKVNNLEKRLMLNNEKRN